MPINSNWTSGTSFTVPNLTVGSNYTFKLISNNGIDSAESLASNTVTVSNFAPNAPTSVTASVSGITATISFTAGTSNNSSAVTSYKYAVSTNGGAYGSFTSSNWTSGTSFTVSNLTVGSNYTFKLKAFNGIDSAESSVSNTVTVSNFAPNAPTTLSANVSGRTAIINFTQDSNGSLAVSSYTYAASTNGVTYGPFINTNLTQISATQVTISGLTTSTNYTFKLKANNGIDSSESLASNTVTVAPSGPNPPTITSINVSGRTATINFTPGAANGSSAVTGYKYAYSTTTSTGTYTPSLFTSTDLSWINGTTSLTVTNLPAGTLYLKLMATNGNDGDASTASSAVTVANFAPNAPTITSVSASNGIATINFTQTDNKSLTVSSYKYAYSTTTSTGTYTPALFTTNNLSWTSGTTSLTVSNLPVGTLYLKLIANNGIDSSSSSPSNAVTVANYEPYAPTTLSASVSRTTATITFTPTTNNSNTVSSYFYAMSTNGGAYSSPFTLSNWTAGTSFFTVTGLIVGNNYTFKLKAYNGIISAESNASNTVTVANFAPDAPRNLIASVSNGIVTIDFTQDSNGSQAVSSYKYALSTNNGSTYGSFTSNNLIKVSSTKVTISGLTIGTRYNFILKANNGIDSAESIASNQVTVANFAPAAPTITNVVVSGRTATINFTPGNPNGSLAISGYKYAYSTTVDGSYSFSNSNWTSGSQITVSNLPTGPSYFKLQATNGIDSNASIASNEVLVVPDSPIINRINLSGLTSVIINFTQPGISATDVNSYQYSFKTSVGGSYSSYRNTNLSWTSGTFSLTISNLTPGLTYYYKLKAYKNTISSNESNESSGLFINFAPATPQISSVEASNGTATINFTVSNNGSAAITKYMYSTDSPITSNSLFNDFPLINGLEQITSPLLINRLTNGSTYSFTIRGSNGIDSASSNTINNIVMLPTPLSPRITGGELKNETATLYIVNSDPASITNYAYSTDGANYTTFNPVQNTTTLTIAGLSTSTSVSLTVKAINGTNFSKPSNQITLIPMLRQPPPTIDASGATAKDLIARIPFSQTLISTNGQDTIVKYVYCRDTTITDSSVFIDVPLRDGFVQTASPLVIPFTISNPETTPSLSLTFKSYTNSGIYSLASTTASVTILYPQPPPIILSTYGDGNGTLYINTNTNSGYNTKTYSYAPRITNFAYSTDGITYGLFNYQSETYKIGSLNTTCSITLKSFNGSYSLPSNTVSNVLIRWNPPPPPVITSITGNKSDGLVVNFTQDTTGLTKDITGFGYMLNGIEYFTITKFNNNLNLLPSLRSFTVDKSLLLNGENEFKMKSSNGKLSDFSALFLINVTSVNSSTYVDPSDSINTVLIRQTAVDQNIQFSTDNENWTDISIGSWPFTIGNNSPDTKLKVKFDTDITLPYLINGKGDYFWLSSNNIIIDGNNKTVTVNDFPYFPGLITNGTEAKNGYNNITIKNISIVSTGTTTLSVGQGWICKTYFGKGATGNIIQNCSSNGIISGSGGGITGKYTAINSTNFSIIGCSASGDILDGAPGGDAGGIVGAASGTNSTSFTITTCTYSGNINGNGSGGIIGGRSTNVSISFCSTSGIIKGGGIAGAKLGEIPAGASTPTQALATISDCFTTGDIGSTVGTKGAWSAGGIIAEQGEVVTITRCYSFGAIGGVGKNSCGGIVGSNAGNSGAIVVQSCFSTGNIYDRCGGIAGSNFGYAANLSNILKIGIYNCYSLGDIGNEAGGIVGPEFAATAAKLCVIDNCYSLGKLLYETSGGIAGVMTWTITTDKWVVIDDELRKAVKPGYPTDKRTVSITNCFNSFSDTLISNSIVGSGFGTPVSDRIKRSTLPSIQYDNLTPYPTVEQNTYLDVLNKYPTTWTKLKLSTDTQRTILRSVNGYYFITPFVISKVPFVKIPSLGFTVSELLINAGLSIQELIPCNIDLTSTKNEFDIAGISIGDLFTAEYGIKLINKIGYPLSTILPFIPNATFKELIDYGINLKNNTPSYTISEVIAPSVQPVLTMLDIINGQFPVSDIKGRTEAIFDLKNMKEAEVPVKYLVGPGGYLTTELKKLGFDVDDFRDSKFPVKTIIDDYGFKLLEFQGSKFSIESYESLIKTNAVSQTMLETIGFPKGDAMTAISLYSQQTNSTTVSINTYISLNIPVSEIPKTLVITNIKNYWDTQQISSNPPGKNTYNPNDFLSRGWTKRQVGRMGFSVKVLLDSNNFDISDLKTIGYSDTVILASGHNLATNVTVKNAGIYTAQNPPIVTRVITDETTMYVYLDFSENNTSDDVISIGYSFDEDASNMTFVPVENPLTILNPDWSIDNYLFLTSFNGIEVGAFNSISVAKYKKPEKKPVVKPNGLRLAFGIALVILAVAIDKLGPKNGGIDGIIGSSITGYLMKKGISEAAKSNVGGQVENVLTTIDRFNKLTSASTIIGVGTGLVGIDASVIGMPPVPLTDVVKQAGGIVMSTGGFIGDMAPLTMVTKDSGGSVCNFKAPRLGFQTRSAYTDGRWAFNPHIIEKLDSLVYIIDRGLAHIRVSDMYLYENKKSQYTEIVTGKILGPKRALTKNKIYLTSKPPTITSVVADLTTITVYFTGGNMKNFESIDNIFYSLDNGKKWQTAGDTVQTSSPFVITGEFKLYEEMNISIRFYDKTDVANVNSGTNVFGMNDFYSNTTTSGKCTYPIKIGKFGEPSNIVPVKMKFLPLVPELYYVRYNSSKSNLARFYLVQYINCSGKIINYEWTKDNGKTWISVGKSFTQLPLGLTSDELSAPASSGKFTTKMTYFDIDVGKVSGLSIMIRAVNSRDLRSNSSEKVTSSIEEINIWINKPANSSVYGKIKI